MKNTILIIAVLALGLNAMAQTQPQEAPKEFDGKGHYLNVDFGVGLSSLMFKLDDGERKGKLGFSGKIGYDYYFTKNWGIGTGLGISWYKTGGKFNNHLTSYDNVMDDDNVYGPNPYQRNIYLRNWEEIQKTLFLEIPLTANFQAKFGEKKRHGIYVNAGLRLQLPLKSTYLAPNERNAENGLLEVQGYYENFDLTLEFQDYVVHGFGYYNNKYDGKNDLKLSLAATAGVGGLFGLTEKLDLYVGARVDYGFLNIKTDGNEKIISSDLSEYYGMAGSDVTEKVNPFSIRGEIGLRVKLVGKKKEKDKTTDALEKQLQYMNNENAKANEDRRRADDDRRKADDDRRRADDDRRRADDDRRNAEERPVVVQTTPGASKPSKSSGNVADDRALLTPVDGYNVGVTSLTNTQKKILDKKIAVLKKNSDVKFSLVGHTCDISNDEVNERIGFERAETVKEYLVSKGIDRSRIVDISTEGKYYPVVENSSESNRKKNRRVEFIIE
jgi:outer membrane protein OmpA-like peptidoglycan-associated protein